MKFEDIKLVIWDLDNTFWSGILSEGEIQQDSRCLQLVKTLTDMGIVNSICSKNDIEPTKKKLQELGVWDLFVFPSIDWTPKGQRIAGIIKDMALRPANVLFLDDQFNNIEEAKHYLPELMTAGPEIMDDFLKWASDESKWKDKQHKRLKQYKILEVKHNESKNYSSNEDFLMASNIRVEIHRDCEKEIERLHELLMRSNQLNFTKIRINIEELRHIISNDSYDCGYVSVKDNYGDYGIVGFFAKTNNHLEHFLFSCRTMGLFVEQYVYATLGFPKLDVVGSVATTLNKTETPKWINQDNTSNTHSNTPNNNTFDGKILIKGPCDLLQAKAYLKINNDCVDTEFTYVSDKGIVIDTYNHSVNILGSKIYSNATKSEILQDCPFIEPGFIESTFFEKEYNIIFLSTLIESTYVIYRKKGTDIKIVLGHSMDSISKQDDVLVQFNQKYECLGYTTPEDYVNFLLQSLSLLPKQTKICLILGVENEIGFSGEEIQRHRTLNNAIRQISKTEDRILTIDLNDFVKNREDLGNSINHFSAKVYFQIAESMVKVINSNTEIKVLSQPKYLIYLDTLLNLIKNSLSWTVSGKSNWFANSLRKLYRKTARKER